MAVIPESGVKQLGVQLLLGNSLEVLGDVRRSSLTGHDGQPAGERQGDVGVHDEVLAVLRRIIGLAGEAHVARGGHNLREIVHARLYDTARVEMNLGVGAPIMKLVPTGTQTDHYINGGLRAGGFHLAVTTPEGVLGRDTWLQALCKREKVVRVEGSPRQVLEAAIRGAEIVVGPLVAEDRQINGLWKALARTSTAYVILAHQGEFPRILKFYSNLTMRFEGQDIRLVKNCLSGGQGFLIPV